MQRSSRVDYDAIAELYDSTPHREKSADPELIAFLAGRGPTASLTLLDIACGTGNQQIANRNVVPNARFVGLDGSLGHCQLNGLRAPSSGPSRLEWGSVIGQQRSSPPELPRRRRAKAGKNAT